MSGGASMTVASVAVSFAVFVSVPPATVTVFAAEEEAVDDTFTVSVIGGNAAPPARLSDRVHVSAGTAHVQPVPDIPVAVKSGGRVSVTVTTPLVGATPALTTVSV